MKTRAIALLFVATMMFAARSRPSDSAAEPRVHMFQQSDGDGMATKPAAKLKSSAYPTNTKKTASAGHASTRSPKIAKSPGNVHPATDSKATASKPAGKSPTQPEPTARANSTESTSLNFRSSATNVSKLSDREAPGSLTWRRNPAKTQTMPPSLATVRHRGPNPAIVSGSHLANSKSTAALDGTQMKRRP